MTSTDTRTRTRLGASYWKLLSANDLNTGDGVGFIAYPWLASAVTRNPLLIGLISVANRLPWLVFSLPADVITDRVDRRITMVVCDALQAVLTLGVALVVFASGQPAGRRRAGLGDRHRPGLYAVLLETTLLLGMAEVLRDNCGQTLMPPWSTPRCSRRRTAACMGRRADGQRLFGPVVGGLLLSITFALPFLVDAGSFAIHGRPRLPHRRSVPGAPSGGR